MPLGGWLYTGFLSDPHDGSTTQTVAETDAWKTAWVAGLAGTGWSLLVDTTAYSNNKCSWFALQHTDGARAIFIRCGYYFGGGGENILVAQNDAYNAIRSVGTYFGTFWCCYVQPHLSATPLGTGPLDVAFLPAGSMKFFPMGEYTQKLDHGKPNGYHVWARGSNLICSIAKNIDDSPPMDTVDLLGECLDRLAHENHPTEPDNHADSKYAHVHWDDCNYSTTFRCQFFDAAQNLRTTSSQAYLSALLTDDVCDRAPWTWQVPTIYVSSTDLSTDGVVTGNGIKGSVNPEWMRYTVLPGGPVNWKQTFDSGNFVYLRSGIAVGHDSSNGNPL